MYYKKINKDYIFFGCQLQCIFVSVIHFYFSFQLIAAIVFLSFGIVSSFLCLVVDGVFILLNIVSTATMKHFYIETTLATAKPPFRTSHQRSIKQTEYPSNKHYIGDIDN